MVHGEPGVGKTALLEDAVAAAEDFRVVRTSGVEGEMQLDHAALQQRCAPILAFGLSAGQAPSPFLVGLAALGLLSDAAEQRPLLLEVVALRSPFAGLAAQASRTSMLSIGKLGPAQAKYYLAKLRGAWMSLPQPRRAQGSARARGRPFPAS